MKLIVISPESEEPREHAMLADFFGAGLAHYHLRKPTWGCAQIVTWLRALPEAFHARIVLHTHHDLANEFAVGGLHVRDGVQRQSNLMAHVETGVFRSRAVHDLTVLRDSLVSGGRVLFSPVFPSISKPGYGPSSAILHADLRAILALPRRAEVIALGGIDVGRIPVCDDLGFDGVAVLGAVWLADDPLRAFNQLHSALHSHAA